MKLNVIQLGSPTGLYGAERWILALIRNLDSSKVNSIVSVVKDDPKLEAQLCTRAAKLGFRTKIFYAYGRFNFSAVIQLRQYIIENDIHILHTHQYKQDIIGLLATCGTRCKIVSTPHGWSRDAGFKLQCYELFNRLIFPFFDAVAPLSPELYENLKPIPYLTHKLTYIQNGVDTIEINECLTTDSQLLEWKAQGFFIIGYIGQLIHRKGLDNLFKAAATLDFKYKIVLIGHGEQQGFLEQLAVDLEISKNVIFFGFKHNRLEYLKGFDVFVLPSRLEGIPRCLMEALAAEIPVISSDIPGSTELIQDGKTGYTYACDNQNELAERLLWYNKNKEALRSLRQNGKTMIHYKYSAHLMADRYTALFESIIDE